MTLWRGTIGSQRLFYTSELDYQVCSTSGERERERERGPRNEARSSILTATCVCKASFNVRDKEVNLHLTPLNPPCPKCLINAVTSLLNCHMDKASPPDYHVPISWSPNTADEAWYWLLAWYWYRPKGIPRSGGLCITSSPAVYCWQGMFYYGQLTINELYLPWTKKKKGLLPGFIQCSFLTVHWVWEGCVRQPGQYTSGLQTKHRHVRPQEKLEFRHSKITFIWVIFRQWWIKSGSSEEGDVRAVSVTKLATWQLTLNWIMLTVTCHIKEPASVNQVSAKPDKKQLRRVEPQQVRQ